MCFRTLFVAVLAASSLCFGADDCPFSQLSPERILLLEKFGSAGSKAERVKIFSSASSQRQLDIIDTLAAQRLVNWGKFVEVRFIEEMYELARHPSAQREASRQALQHLIQVFHSGANPTLYGVGKVDHEATGSGFGTGQTNAEFSRARAVVFACGLAAEGLGGEYENALLLAGLKEVLTGSAGRPVGRGLEAEAVRAGLTLVSDPGSKFSEQLKPVAKSLIK